MVRHLLFDLDGTLVDSLPGIEHAARHALAEVSPERTLPPLAPFVGPPIREVLARALDERDATRLDALVARFRTAYDTQGWRLSMCYPGVATLLTTLRAAGLCCYVVTNKPRAATALILDALGLRASFEDVISPDVCEPRLPTKAGAVALLLARHGLRAEECWLIGDSHDDRAAAEAHGLRFVAAGYGYGGATGGDRLEAPADLARLLREAQGV